MRFTRQLFYHDKQQFQIACGQLLILLNQGIQQTSGIIFQSGQGDSPHPAEEEMMAECELEAKRIAKEIYLALTGYKVTITGAAKDWAKQQSYKITGLMSFSEDSHQLDVYYLHCLLFDSIDLIKILALNSQMLDVQKHAKKMEIMHYADQIFMGLTGERVLESVPFS